MAIILRGKGQAEPEFDDLLINQTDPPETERVNLRSGPRIHWEDQRQTSPPGITMEEIQDMISQQMRAMGIANDTPRYQVGKPYPPAFDIPRYPPTYSVPLFTKFSGDGTNDLNPKQHINHYMIQCGDSARNPAFLCRQFSRSLSRPAFDWYCSLEPGSVRSWDHMVSLFIDRFATTTNQIRLADLAWMKPKPGESAMSYITRWRN